MIHARGPTILLVLSAIIVGAGCASVRTIPSPPDEHVRHVEMIDVESLEIVALPEKDWSQLGREGTRYKNPNTGKYTMVLRAICGACHEKIPHPSYLGPLVPLIKPPAMTDEEMHRIMGEAFAEHRRIEREYACPKCGQLDPISR